MDLIGKRTWGLRAHRSATPATGVPQVPRAAQHQRCGGPAPQLRPDGRGLLSCRDGEPARLCRGPHRHACVRAACLAACSCVRAACLACMRGARREALPAWCPRAPRRRGGPWQTPLQPSWHREGRSLSYKKSSFHIHCVCSLCASSRPRHAASSILGHAGRCILFANS